MKKIIVIFALVCIGAIAFAHPPKDVVLTYDPATMMMSVTVTHPIKQSAATDPKQHFVKELAVTKNGAQVSVTKYSYQQFDEGETVVFKLSLKSGDKVSVTAACSLAGAKTSEYTVK